MKVTFTETCFEIAWPFSGNSFVAFSKRVVTAAAIPCYHDNTSATQRSVADVLQSLHVADSCAVKVERL